MLSATPAGAAPAPGASMNEVAAEDQRDGLDIAGDLSPGPARDDHVGIALTDRERTARAYGRETGIDQILDTAADAQFYEILGGVEVGHLVDPVAENESVRTGTARHGVV